MASEAYTLMPLVLVTLLKARQANDSSLLHDSQMSTEELSVSSIFGLHDVFLLTKPQEELGSPSLVPPKNGGKQMLRVPVCSFTVVSHQFWGLNSHEWKICNC
ncbi:hypothetical protein K2173_011446 [Erythroxylum novogranatense]|uniref:Uncharacterized protein n=1 Tax=Erythroxylum novogranatense TaxID=1862640 RepID=A0AAV8TEF5_9ROSI|nr:hypothetical protein K2173_011446 [Erythroxylum novogranatense]